MVLRVCEISWKKYLIGYWNLTLFRVILIPHTHFKTENQLQDKKYLSAWEWILNAITAMVTQEYVAIKDMFLHHYTHTAI